MNNIFNSENAVRYNKHGKKLKISTALIAGAAAVMLLCGAAQDSTAALTAPKCETLTSAKAFKPARQNKAHFAKNEKEKPSELLSDWNDWTDIIQTESCYGDWMLLGLRKDGTINAYYQNVFSTDSIPQDFNSLGEAEQKFVQEVTSWRLIKKLYVNNYQYGYGNIVLGLHEDGHVSSAVRDNKDLNISKTVHYWRDIEDIFIFENTILGVKKDGTVVSNDPEKQAELASWKDIKSVCCTNDGIIGIKKDGTACTTNKDRYDVSSWKGVTEIILNDSFCGTEIYGLSEDGELFVSNPFKDNPDWKPSKKIKTLSVYGTPTGGVEYYISTDGQIMEMYSAEWYSEISLLKNAYAQDAIVDFSLTENGMQKTVYLTNVQGKVKVYTLRTDSSNGQFYLTDKKAVDSPDFYVSFVRYCPFYGYAKLAMTDDGRIVKVVDGK